MWLGILAAESVIFIVSAISSVSRLTFNGVSALHGSRIHCSISVGHFVGPGCSAAIDHSSTCLLIEVSATATEMVFPFLRTVVH